MQNTEAWNICREKKKWKKNMKSLQSIHSNKSCVPPSPTPFLSQNTFFFLLHTACARPLSPTNLSWGKHYITSNWWFKSENHACHLKPKNFQILQLFDHVNRAQAGTTNTFSRCHPGCGKILSKTQAKPMCNNKCHSRSQHMLWNSTALLGCGAFRVPSAIYQQKHGKLQT